jgi:hypothetical protein
MAAIIDYRGVTPKPVDQPLPGRGPFRSFYHGLRAAGLLIFTRFISKIALGAIQNAPRCRGHPGGNQREGG